MSLLLRSRNLENRFFHKIPLLGESKVGTGSGSRTSCHDHFLKLQAGFLPSLEFHTLHTNNYQEGEAQAWFFIFIDSRVYSCVTNKAAALNPPEPEEQMRMTSVAALPQMLSAGRDLYCHHLAFVGVPDTASMW